MAAPKILGLGGSPRRGGNTDALLREILRGATSVGAKVEHVFLRDYAITACDGCEACRRAKTCTRFKDGMQLLYPKVEAAQGIVLGSPTHTYNVTAMTKAFIDRLYPFYEFDPANRRKWYSRLAGQNRKALVFSVCEQPEPESLGVTLPAMRLALEALGYKVVDEMGVTGFFARAAVRKDLAVLDEAYARGRALALALGGKTALDEGGGDRRKHSEVND